MFLEDKRLQTLFINASICYIVIFFTGIIAAKKIKVSKKWIKFSFLLFTLSLSIFAYYLNPPSNWDLSRHFYCLDSIRNSGTSLSEFLFHNKSSIGGKEFTSFVSFNLVRYVIVKLFDSNHMLPCFCVFVDYLIISYIMVDWSSENAKNGKVKVTSFLLCFTFFPLIHAISGMRTALAATIMGLGIYLYLYKEKKIFIFIVPSIIAVTIHPVMLIAVPFVFLARFKLGVKGLIIVFAVSLLVERGATYLLSSKYSYFARIAYLYKRYTSGDQYRGERFSLFGVIIIILVLIVIFFIMRKKYEEQYWSKTHSLLYSFLMYYIFFILGNLGNYDMILRPSYLLGVFAPVLSSLVTNTEEWYWANTKYLLHLAQLAICTVCIYVCYRYMQQFMQGY